MLVSLLALLNIATFIFISCEGQLPELELVRFSGVVSDSFTSEPLQGATVIISDYDSLSSRSSVSGSFEFLRLKLDDGTYELLVINEDYVDAKGFVTIKEGQQEGTVSIAMTPKEGLEFDRTLADFGASLDSLIISVTNVSPKDLDVSLSPSSPWTSTKTSSFRIISGSSIQLTLKVSRENLAVGVHEATVSFAVVGRPTQSLLIQCQILDPESARLAISQTSLDFGKATSAQNIKVSNKGKSTLEWTAGISASWITVDPKSGSVGEDQEQNITVIIDRQSMTEEGLYAGEVSFSSNGGTFTLTIAAEVDKSIGILEIDPVSLDFGRTDSRKSIRISNKGESEITWTATTEESWLSIILSGVSNTLAANAFRNLDIEINRVGLERGMYSGTIVFTANGEESSLNVSMEVAIGELVLSADSIGFGLAETSFTLGLQNQGNATISWTSSDTEDWISRDKSGGSLAAGAGTSVNVSVSRIGKEKGDYVGTVSIAAGDEVFNIPVTMQSPGGVLTLSLEELDFGSDQSSKSINLGNSGTVSVDWSATTEDAWLSLGKSSGAISRGSSYALSITANRNGLEKGTYEGLVVFEANGESASVAVSMEVAIGEIILNTDSIGYGLDKNSFSLELKNQGNASISWTSSDTEDWISRDKSSGTLAAGSSTSVNVSVSRIGKEKGDYVGTVSIAAGDEVFNVPITMQSPGGVLTLSLEELDLGSDQSSKSINLGNSGTVSVNWSATTEDAWLSLGKSSGAISRGSSYALSITANRNGLEKGTYEGLVVFEANGATLNLPVHLSSPGGFLSVDVSSLSFDYNDTSLPIKLTNSGTAPLSWEASTSTPWVTMQTTSGNLGQGAAITLVLTVLREGLAKGQYNSSVTFSSGGENLEIPISMIVEGGVLSFTPSNLNFGGSESNLFVTIANTGLGTLNWTASESESWLGINATSDILAAGAQTSLSVTVNRNGLALGTYSAQIALSGDGGQGYITIQMQVEQDTDNDGIPDNIDADNDNDGLIDIYTINDLYDMRYDLTASGTSLQGAPASGFIGYELMNDLDFSSDADYDDISLKAEVTTGSGWLPIGNDPNRFNTIFDGNDYSISELLINRTTDYNGLFGHTNNLADIRNIKIAIKFLSGGNRTAGLIGRNYLGKIENCHISGSVTGNDDVGLLIGEDRDGTITNCSSSGLLTGRDAVGGLIGDFDNNGISTLKFSFSNASVKGNGLVGGLVGTTSNNSVIASCYAMGSITATDEYSGGLIGYLHSGATLTSCYATGNISSSYRYVGGLVGWAYGTINSCYSTGTPIGTSNVGGLIGGQSGNIASTNYWDVGTSGTSTSAVGSGLTTTELQGQTSASGIYITWSSDDWDFGTSTQYPALKNMPGGLDIQR